MEGPLHLSSVAEFQAILDGSLDPMGIADDGGRFVWVNDAGARFFGFERDELVGAHFRDRLVEEEAPGDAMRRAQLGYAAAVVRRVRRKDDTVAVMRFELIPIGDGNVLIHGTDHTVLYETLDRITETRSVLIRAQEIGHTSSWVMHSPQHDVRWFGPIAELLGEDPGSTASGKVIPDHLLHPDDLMIPDDIVQRAIDAGSADGEFRTIHPEQGTRWMHMYAQCTHDEAAGEQGRLEGVVHDISDYRAQDERYRELLDAVRVPMLIWTRDIGLEPTAVRFANQPFCDLVGASMSEVIGSVPGGWVVDDDRRTVTAHTNRAFDGELPPPQEFRLRRADGSAASCLIVTTRVVYQGRASLCAQIVDISEEIRLRELASRARETNMALAVAAGVAHDFNNLLTSVLSYLDFALTELDEESGPGRYVQASRLAAQRAANLAQALLGYSRSSAINGVTQEGEPEPDSVVDVSDVVREVYAITRATVDAKVDIITHEAEAPAHASIAADSLLRVLVNLLMNSRDAVLERAATAGPEYRPTIDLAVVVWKHNATATITVSDNGIGIPHEFEARVFEPFFTTKGGQGGSGIGLSAARDLARAAGGELSFASQLGVGTTFSLTLPLVAAPRAIEVEPPYPTR